MIYKTITNIANLFKVKIFLLLLIFISFKMRGQYSYKEISEKYTNVNLSSKKVDSILLTLKNNDSTYIKAVHSFSFFFYKKRKNYDLAIKYGKIGAYMREKANLKTKKHTISLYNLGRFHFFKKEYDKAIEYYNKAIDNKIYQKKIGEAYTQIALCLHKKGELYSSINYFKKGLIILEKYGTIKNTISPKINLAYVCKDLNTKESVSLGIKVLKEVDNILNQNPTLVRDDNFYPLNTNLANLYALNHSYNFNKSKFYYHRNLKEAFKNNNKKNIVYSFLNLGDLYLNKKNDSALYFLKKSLIHSTHLKNSKDYHVEIFRNIATFYYTKGKLKKALNTINKPFNSSDKNIYDLTKNELLNVTNKKNIVDALKQKVKILISLYEESKEIYFLNESIKTVHFLDKIIDLIINYSTEAETKFFWRNEISEIYSLGVKTSYLLNDSSLLFKFIEKNKAFLLTQNINENIKFLDLPDKVKNQDLFYKKTILRLENNTSSKTHKDSLFYFKEKYFKFKNLITKTHPTYFKFKKKIVYIPLSTVKQNLDNEKTIFSFSLFDINDSIYKLYGIIISKNKSILFTSKISKQTINKYRELISKPLKSKSELFFFKENSFDLYNQFFPTDEIKSLVQKKNLIIIPDTSIENLPFESLNTEKNSVKYFIENCNISYAYSYSFLSYNKQLERNTEIDLVSFAPVHFEDPKLISLNNTIQETKNINNLLNGKIFQNKKANRTFFLKNSSNSKIIHLATHANYSQTPTIYFSNDSLKLHELYTFKNNADLTVLSACETNLGEIKKGEGTLSLTRGFFHSGSNSVLSSLWNVNDKSTTTIMTEFYKNLKDNQSKNEAISNAKRKYLKTHSLSGKSPYYWASFILIGDTEPVFSNTIWIYIAIGLTLFLLIFYFFKKRG